MRRKAFFFAALAAFMMVTELPAQNYKRGDVDNSGAVTLKDMVTWISSANDAQVTVEGLTDVNANGQTDVQDAFLLADILLQKYQETPHECVDLGLPSGTLWASVNVGGTTATDEGQYVAWGEYAEKDNYMTSTYFDPTLSLSKNSTNIIGTRYDAATVQWGEDWQMPTREQQQELENECNWNWTTQSGMQGMKVTSKTNGNSIFLPAAGYRHGTEASLYNSYGFFWNGDHPNGANGECIAFTGNEQGIFLTYCSCVNGRSIRAVCAKK